MLGDHVEILNKHLNSYSYSSGGGMRGGYFRKTVNRRNDSAVIRIESAEWYSQNPSVEEYQVSTDVLDELEAVIRKYKMNDWNRKKFTDMFISDGESYSYSFDFDGNTISFSSQYYPEEYGDKLNELESVVKKYIEASQSLEM